MTDAIELSHVTKRYGTLLAVDDLSLAVPEGALFGLIGPNGAGKTTTFSLLSGFIRATSGEVRVRGVPLRLGHPPLGRVLALPQDASIPPGMTLEGVLVMLGRLAGHRRSEALLRGQRALDRVGLTEAKDRRIGVLSHGQRRRVGIASTLLGDDELILLDEPTAGLDPRTAGELREMISALRGERTIVLSSHNLQEIESLCTHAAILAKGRLVAIGSMEEIKGTRTLVQVTLTRPLESETTARAALAALSGVASVDVASDGLRIDFELMRTSADLDDLTSTLLKMLLEHGASVKSVERGKTLEQRFMEATAKS